MSAQPQPTDLTAADLLAALHECSGDKVEIHFDARLHLSIARSDGGKTATASSPGDQFLKLHDGEPGLTRVQLITRLEELSHSFPERFKRPIQAHVPFRAGVTTGGAWYFIERVDDRPHDGEIITTIYVRHFPALHSKVF